ncbi:hypothetical protein IIA16_03960 [bacterium]|nr:hypothetical protein [bacterium]
MTPRTDPATLERFLAEEQAETLALRRKLQRLQNPPPDEAIFVWPGVIKQVITGAVVLTLLLSIASIIFNAPLEDIADTGHTPSPSRAPWYFVGLQELLVYFDPWLAGVVIPTMIIIGLILIPFIDTNLKGIGRWAPKERPFAVFVFGVGLVMWFALIYIGLYLRGTNWDMYGPFDCWRGAQEPFHYRACPEGSGDRAAMAAADGSEMVNVVGTRYGQGALWELVERNDRGELAATIFVWREWVLEDGTRTQAQWGPLPSPLSLPLAYTPFKDAAGNTLAPEHPKHMAIGLLILGVWYAAFFVLPLFFAPLFVRRLGLWRYATAMFFSASLFGVLGKMVWRISFGLKYILVTPWLNI